MGTDQSKASGIAEIYEKNSGMHPARRRGWAIAGE